MKRDLSFDIMKGIGIIAMIVGHISIPEVGRYIYLWHMPLFFLISGYFFKEKGMKDCVKSNAKTLLIPYLLTATALALFTIFLAFTGHNVSVTNALLAIFIGAESIQNSIFSDYQIGAIWFLMALFWCRVIYNYLSPKFSGGVILTIAVIATYIGTLIFIPTNLLQGLSAMTFFMVGHKVREGGLLKKKICIPVIVLGIVSIVVSLLASKNMYPISMATCFYSYYPINVIAAIFATYLIYQLSIWLAGFKFSILLSFLGRISLLILCVHLLDIKLGFASAISKRLLNETVLVKSFIICWHIAVPLLLSVLLYKLSWIRKLFQLK